MRRGAQRLVGVVVVGGLALAGCAQTSATEESGDKSAKIVEVEGSDVKRVVLTNRAVERLDIQTAPVAEEAGAQVVPYAAVVYDPSGNTWVFTSPEPLTYARSPITITRIAGDKAFLAAGPATGTPVVTVGTAELYGAENEIGH